MRLAAYISGWLWRWTAAGWSAPVTLRGRGAFVAVFGLLSVMALATYRAADPSWNTATGAAPENMVGNFGATLADAAMQSFGFAAWIAILLVIASGLRRLGDPEPQTSRGALRSRAAVGALGVVALAGVLAAPSPPADWPLARGLGGFWGDTALGGIEGLIDSIGLPHGKIAGAVILALVALPTLVYALGLSLGEVIAFIPWRGAAEAEVEPEPKPKPARRRVKAAPEPEEEEDDAEEEEDEDAEEDEEDEDEEHASSPSLRARVSPGSRAGKPSKREERENQTVFEFAEEGGFALPELSMLVKPKPRCRPTPRCSRACWPSSVCAARSTRFGPGPWSPSTSWSPRRA
jgi:S-DNA-T family DNA segregation ATPase FtsK/SpoIIIE